MKILFVASEFPPCTGGISVFSSNLLVQLLNQGHQIFLCVPKGTIVPSHYNLKKVTYYDPKWIMRQFSIIFIKQITNNRIDLIFFSKFLGSSWIGILLLAKVFRMPAIALCHGWELHYLKWHPVDNLGLKIGLKTLALGLANSNFCKDLMLREGMKSSRLAVLTPGINPYNYTCWNGDTNFLREKYQIPDNGIVLLTVCRIEELKGIDLIVEAMNNLKDSFPQLIYVVVGTVAKWAKKYYESLLAKVKQYGLEKKVLFLGYIPYDKIRFIYKLADIYVSPSRIETHNSSPREESFGITYLEAAANELSCIGTKTGGISDAVEDGVTGILVENENVEELTSAIKYLLNNPLATAEMGKKGKERADKHFTWEKVGKRLEAHLESIVRR
ncbi:MAG: glycosyltransferase family 4 protein [Thermodesulfobacteriota bacterium]|nr:glycosyltransferase family 4 protein [Thermodesulfobacteriota bacterium]